MGMQIEAALDIFTGTKAFSSVTYRLEQDDLDPSKKRLVFRIIVSIIILWDLDRQAL